MKRHIKLGLIKQFVTKSDETLKAVSCLKVLFPKFSDTKAKVEVFVSSQIGQVLADEKFPTFLKCIQKVSWNAPKAVPNF